MFIRCRLAVNAAVREERCSSGEVMSTHHGEIIFNGRIVQELTPAS